MAAHKGRATGIRTNYSGGKRGEERLAALKVWEAYNAKKEQEKRDADSD